MKPLLISIAMVLFTALAASADTGTTTVVARKPHFEATEVVTRHATVLAIDTEKRVLTLLGEKGDTLVVPVKPDVKTFSQIKVGDHIKATYTDRFTIDAAEGAATDLVNEKMRADAKAGETPKVTLTERTTYGARISAIDQKKGVVTLKDEGGEEFTVTPVNPENLSLVKVGDVVTFAMTHSLVAKVVPAPSKKKAATPAKK